MGPHPGKVSLPLTSYEVIQQEQQGNKSRESEKPGATLDQNGRITNWKDCCNQNTLFSRFHNFVTESS